MKIGAVYGASLLGPGEYVVVSFGLYKNIDNSISHESEPYMVLDRAFELKVNPPGPISNVIGIVNQDAVWSIRSQ